MSASLDITRPPNPTSSWPLTLLARVRRLSRLARGQDGTNPGVRVRRGLVCHEGHLSSVGGVVHPPARYGGQSYRTGGGVARHRPALPCGAVRGRLMRGTPVTSGGGLGSSRGRPHREYGLFLEPGGVVNLLPVHEPHGTPGRRLAPVEFPDDATYQHFGTRRNLDGPDSFTAWWPQRGHWSSPPPGSREFPGGLRNSPGTSRPSPCRSPASTRAPWPIGRLRRCRHRAERDRPLLVRPVGQARL
jgi:hypothetical protein